MLFLFVGIHNMANIMLVSCMGENFRVFSTLVWFLKKNNAKCLSFPFPSPVLVMQSIVFV